MGNGGAARLAVGFAGTAAVRRETAGFVLTEAEYAGGLVQPRHGHGPAYFSSVESGAYDETFGGRTEEIVAPHLVFHPAGEEHGVRFRAGTTRILRIETSPALLRRLGDAGTRLAARPRRLTGDTSWIVARNPARARPAGRLLPIRSRGPRHRASRPRPPERSRPDGRTRRPDVARRARQRYPLRAGFRTRGSLAEAAEAAGCTRSRSRGEFEEALGISAGELIKTPAHGGSRPPPPHGQRAARDDRPRDRLRGPGAPRARLSARRRAPDAGRIPRRAPGRLRRSRDRRVQAGARSID